VRVVVKTRLIAPRTEKADKLLVIMRMRENTLEEFYNKYQTLLEALANSVFAREVVLEPLREMHGERLFRSILSILLHHCRREDSVIVELDSKDIVLNTALIFATLSLPNPSVKIYAEGLDSEITIDIDKYRKLRRLVKMNLVVEKNGKYESKYPFF